MIRTIPDHYDPHLLAAYLHHRGSLEQMLSSVSFGVSGFYVGTVYFGSLAYGIPGFNSHTFDPATCASPMPARGFLSHFRFVMSQHQDDQPSLTCTITKNGQPTILSAVAPRNAAVGVYSDLVHSVDVNGGDMIGFKLVVGPESSSFISEVAGWSLKYTVEPQVNLENA